MDAQFYSRENLLATNRLDILGAKPITDFVAVSDGNHMGVSDKFVDDADGIPYYRGSDIYNLFIEQSSAPMRIDRSTFLMPQMTRSHLRKGDVLMSIVGAIIGNMSLVTKDVEAACSCKLAILRPHAIRAELLSVFLSSYFGQIQVQKFKRGAAQTGLILEDFDQLKIPDFSKKFELKIVSTVKSAFEATEATTKVLAKAENLLLNTLGIASFAPSPEIVNIKSLKESFVSTGRLDAEHYQPKYDQLHQTLSAYSGGTTTVDSLAFEITNGAEVREYQESGTPYLRIGDLKLLDIDAASVVYIDPVGAEKGLEKIGLRVGDVLLSRSGSLAVSAVVESTWENALISSHLIRLRIRDTRIDPYFLALFFMTFPGKMQIQKWSNGGVQPEISQPAVKALIVPILPMPTQHEIRRLILEARRLRTVAEALLEAAKRAVEIAIEQDEAAGMAYLAIEGALA